MNILLLSPYDAGSHRYWREGMQRMLREHNVTPVCLPGRHFSWRVRGNSLTLAHEPLVHQDYDLVIATSLTDLSALRGFVPTLGGVPTILYFHENQFAYPTRGDDPHQVDRQMTSIYSAVAADRLVFNSDYNRQSFLAGAAGLLGKMPDGVPPGLTSRLESKTDVIPVPLAPGSFRDSQAEAGGRAIVWNHRWEYDKGTLRLQEILAELIRRGGDFTVHLLGQQFRGEDAVMRENQALLESSGHLGHCGFLDDREAYLALLAQSHLVLSTANHEFQGLSVQEAMACGCVPVVPDDLAYPGYVGDAHRYGSIGAACDKLLEPLSGLPDTTGILDENAAGSRWATEIERCDTAVAY